jgi:hypothetical protein
MGKKHGPFHPKVGRGVKLLLIIHAVLLFAGLYAHLSTYRLYSVMPELYWHLPHPARDVQQLAILAQLCSSFMTALFFLLWTYRSYRHLSALSDRDLRFSPGWAVGWFFAPIMNLFRPYQVMKEIWEESDPGAGPSRPGERPVSPLLLELVASQQFARRSDGCQAHGSGGIGTLHVPDRYRRHPSLLGHLFLGARD